MSFVAAMFSCSDDIAYTTDSSASISFSKDTVTFDTVFSSMGSSTKNFQVYNDNDKAVRLRSVRLASDGRSGFRLNVDGQSGTSLKDIDILAKDSIYVFVEVRVNPQDEDSPVRVRDSLIFTLENGNAKQVILEAYGQDIVVLKGHVVAGDETFGSARPYLIYDSLRVDEGATLTISEGTTLCFHSGAELLVHGRLVAEGTVENPVTFRGDRTDKMFAYLPYDRLDGLWGGIHLYPQSPGQRTQPCRHPFGHIRHTV